MQAIKTIHNVPISPAPATLPVPVTPGLRSPDDSTADTAYPPTISPEPPHNGRPPASPVPVALTVGEMTRRALLTSHYVYAAYVPGALARALRGTDNLEPSRLNLRV